jgi:hypothetical protein
MTYLYHGSTTQNLLELRPHKRYSPGTIDYPALYATPLPAFAAAHSFPWSTNEGVNLNVYNGNVELSLPSNLEERLQLPISIYKVSSDDFEHTKEESTGYTWHSKSAIPIIEETKYSSVKEALEKLGAKLIIL